MNKKQLKGNKQMTHRQMTRDELIEKVAFDCQFYVSRKEAEELACDVIDTIFDALKEPTLQMSLAYLKLLSSEQQRDINGIESYKAMLNASPLAKEGE